MAASTATATQKTAIGELELVECWYDDDPTTRVRFGAALDAASGASACSTFLLEVPAAHRTPWHTHSAEEVVFVLEGDAEAGIGDERLALGPGDLALIPPHVPHGLENVGEEPLRFLGFFASAAMVHVFDQPMQPFGTPVLVTPPPDQLPIPVRS